MRPQWTRQTMGLHGPASTETPASDTPRSAPSGLSARDRRRCREQRWDKPDIDESHRQAGLAQVWQDRAGVGRERISRTANRWRGYPPLGEVCPSPPAPRLNSGRGLRVRFAGNHAGNHGLVTIDHRPRFRGYPAGYLGLGYQPSGCPRPALSLHDRRNSTFLWSSWGSLSSAPIHWLPIAPFPLRWLAPCSIRHAACIDRCGRSRPACTAYPPWCVRHRSGRRDRAAAVDRRAADTDSRAHAIRLRGDHARRDTRAIGGGALDPDQSALRSSLFSPCCFLRARVLVA